MESVDLLLHQMTHPPLGVAYSPVIVAFLLISVYIFLRQRYQWGLGTFFIYILFGGVTFFVCTLILMDFTFLYHLFPKSFSPYWYFPLAFSLGELAGFALFLWQVARKRKRVQGGQVFIKTTAKISKSIHWFYVGVGVFLLSFLALYLPGHNFHGGGLTMVNLLLFYFGPVVLFTIGLLKGLPKNKINGWHGLALNLFGLFFHFLTLAGFLN